MEKKLLAVLERLSRVIEPRKNELRDALYAEVLAYHPVNRLPVVMIYPLDEADLFLQAECLIDPEKMLYNQLVHAFGTSIIHNCEVGDDLPYTVRADFGTVLIASMCNATVEYRNNDPGWVRPLGSIESCRKLFSTDPTQRCKQGLGNRVVETYGQYHHMLSQFREVYQAIDIVLPDTQGPFDTAEQLLGSEIYVQLYENPRFVSDLLAYICEVQISFLEMMAPLVREHMEGFSHQHAVTIRGNILIRNDSTTLVSPRMYADAIAPHDGFVLESLEGGGIHSCGKIEQLIPRYLQIPGIRCIDIGQPELNDVDSIYTQVRKHKIPLVRIAVSKDDLVDGSICQRFPTGVVLVHHASSVEEAKHTMQEYIGISEEA